MTDVYRFLLAVVVAQSHLLAAGIASAAWQAVFAFYVLSGFLMTLILNETYGFGASNFLRFCANRILRLYPAYYAVMIIGAAHIALIGPLNAINPVLTLPHTVRDIAANLAIVGLVGFDETQVVPARLVPIGWSLGIELFCYALLGIYFARSPGRLLAMLVIGLVIACVQVWHGVKTGAPDYAFADRYVSLQAGLIPFAAGGLAYFYRRARIFAPSAMKIAMLAGLWAINLGLCATLEFHARVTGLYAAVPLNFLLVPLLFRHDLSAPKLAWQRTLGGIAYPLFIAHWLIGTLVALYVPALPAKEWGFFLVSMAATVAFAWLVYTMVDTKIENLRWRIKRRPADGTVSAPAATAAATPR